MDWTLEISRGKVHSLIDKREIEQHARRFGRYFLDLVVPRIRI